MQYCTQNSAQTLDNLKSADSANTFYRHRPQ